MAMVLILIKMENNYKLNGIWVCYKQIDLYIFILNFYFLFNY